MSSRRSRRSPRIDFTGYRQSDATFTRVDGSGFRRSAALRPTTFSDRRDAGSVVPTSVYLEIGNKKVFAGAIDWPGWCRSAKTEEAALAALAAYAPRYAPVARHAGLRLPANATRDFTVVERLAGSATTDFGAPGAIPSVDFAAVDRRQAKRMSALVTSAWAALDDVVAAAPARLRKGPRGGGRDRDAIASHVTDAEVAYARKIGVRLRPASKDAQADVSLRAAILEVLSSPAPAANRDAPGWPRRYAARRIAWHALDHAWEIQDRS